MPEPVEKSIESIKRIVGMAFQKTDMPSPAPTAKPENAEAILKANAELLMEMMEVTYVAKDALDVNQYKSLLSSLNQGASLEGIYRGLVMSSRYRVLESKGRAASPLAIKFFALEMADLQMTMRHPTQFNRETAKDFPTIDFPEGGDSVNADEAAPSEVQPQALSRMELTESILQKFIGATTYTLKRVLAEEAMKKMEEMSASRGDLAHWYSALVVHLTEANVDFGLPLRNEPNSGFHFKFAQTVSYDRVLWEVLNRYHRVLNSMN